MIKALVNWFKEKFRTTPRKWFVSDLHYSHKNVIIYCNRPWKDVHTMNKAMTKIWNKTVKKIDIVYFLGDFSLNPNVNVKVIPLLNGMKVFVAGNHDGCHKSHKKCKKFTWKYLDAGWDYVVTDTMELTLKDGTNVLLSHLPYKPSSNENLDTRYLEYRPEDKGQILLHGHLHARYRKKGKQIDVGFDGDYKLWSEDEIINLIKDKRDYIPSPITEFYNNKRSNEIS